MPLRSCDRQADHPLIVGGDALADTPEPIAPFFDVLIPGDGEEPVVALAELLRGTKPFSLDKVASDVTKSSQTVTEKQFLVPGKGYRSMGLCQP